MSLLINNRVIEKERTHKTSCKTNVLVMLTVPFCITELDVPLGNHTTIGFVHAMAEKQDGDLTMWSVAPVSNHALFEHLCCRSFIWIRFNFH